LGWTNWKPIENRDDDYRGPACYELGKQLPDAPNGTGVETVLVGATEDEAKCINDLISTLKLPTSVFLDEDNKSKKFVCHTWRFQNKNEAIDLMKKCLTDSPDKSPWKRYPWFGYYTKDLFKKYERFPEFLDNAELLLSFLPNPEKANLLDNMGSAFQKLGKNKEALKCLDQALDIDPHFESARGHREEIRTQFKKTDGETQDMRSFQQITKTSQTITSHDSLKSQNNRDLIFISSKSEDFDYPQQVYTFLKERGYNVFFSEETLADQGISDYRKGIDRALDVSKHMIVLTSKKEYVEGDWVEAEWGLFINEKRSGRKLGNIVTLINGGMQIEDLPSSLRYYEVIPFDPKSFEKILKYLK